MWSYMYTTEYNQTQPSIQCYQCAGQGEGQDQYGCGQHCLVLPCLVCLLVHSGPAGTMSAVLRVGSLQSSLSTQPSTVPLIKQTFPSAAR